MTTKTLKQLFEEIEYPNDFPKGELKAVKEWLTQQPMIIVKYEKTKETIAYLNRDELLEELKK